MVDSWDGMIRSDLISSERRNRAPALIMPRGIGSRYWCAFNKCRVLSSSFVELYIPDEVWGSDVHYCLWAYMNSSLVWLFREVTGRRNLGGGMLKSEASDMKSLPVTYDFDFGSHARGVLDVLKDREPRPVSEELWSREHLLLDEIVAEFFGIGDAMESIREALMERVEFRRKRARGGARACRGSVTRLTGQLWLVDERQWRDANG